MGRFSRTERWLKRIRTALKLCVDRNSKKRSRLPCVRPSTVPFSPSAPNQLTPCAQQPVGSAAASVSVSVCSNLYREGNSVCADLPIPRAKVD